jgi:hypothetical protein
MTTLRFHLSLPSRVFQRQSRFCPPLTHFMLFISVRMFNIAKQSHLMHNTTVYLFNLCLQFISPTCFGNNYAIIKGGGLHQIT